MLVQVTLILVAYYMGRKNIRIDELFFLTKVLLDKDENR